MDHTMTEIFEMIHNDPDTSFDFSYSSEDDLNNIEAMGRFIEENDLYEYVAEDDGTMIFLDHNDYDFQIVIISEGLGDFFTHGIYMSHINH